MIKEKEQFVLTIYNLGIMKFGNFTLKSGYSSPIYIDFRPIASKPNLLIKLSDLLLHTISYYNFELICGVPYAALPIATTLSIRYNIPLIIKRKENKGYGTQKMIEGIYKKGQNCLLIEDVITSGESLLNTAEGLKKEGLVIQNILSILDREQGGIENITNKGFKINTLFKIGEVINILDKQKLFKQQEIYYINKFLKQKTNIKFKKRRLSYEEKQQNISHPIGKKLIDITIKKKTNLIFSADLIYSNQILNFAHLIGDLICVLKLHVDIIRDFSYSFIQKLKQISIKKNFLIFEDKKLCDVAYTNYLQLHHGIHRISSWADIVSTHVIAGEDSINNLNIPYNTMGLVTISEMSSYGRISDDQFFIQSLKISLRNSTVIGTVAQRKVDDRLLLFTPGILLSSNDISSSNKHSSYITPNKAITQYQSDFIIVGKAIYQSKYPKYFAKKYRYEGWEAYQNEL
ncbi:orotate phosphoribosyltransferase [Blattabacterium cuenoti]|uniref:orotate phosphoribosyltransferase n=1 Tax=Blattabacterium cuenoti TaxID=1653831 RepID=UPI00293BB81D|nr:orotate phosphoribosyltransferase [Blattabacterium cuenoti]